MPLRGHFLELKMLEKLVLRVQELEKAIEQSAANHNALCGALQEAKNIYHLAVEAAPAVEAAVEAVEPIVDALE